MSRSPALLHGKTARVEQGDTRTQFWSIGQGHTERGRRLEKQNK